MTTTTTMTTLETSTNMYSASVSVTANTNSKYSQYIFYASTGDGSTIKNLIDTFCKQLCKLEFILNKNGIFSQIMNGKDKNNILFDLNLTSKEFDEFYCEPELTCIGLNAYHTQNQTYSIKKKNTITMYISKDNPDRFYIEVIPQINGESRRKRGYVTIQKIQNKVIPLPLNYNNPILIESADYHKMCKDISRTHSKKIMLDVGSNWIRFRGESREITGCDFIFGKNIDENVLYTQTYDCSSLNSFVKASSMSKNKVKIFTGMVDEMHRPLKLSFGAGFLGCLDIYIKSDELEVQEKESVSDNEDDNSTVYSDDE